MISKKIQKALNDQINAELYSSYIYLSMSAWFETQNLPGFASWMRIQATEEAGHAMKFYSHINERGGAVTVEAINKPPVSWKTPRDVFNQALDISAYSLVAVAGRAKDIMPNGGSVLAMSYYGSEKAIPGYNVMGVAKAALEACTRYLAAELGEYGIRVNTISAGPIRTLSSMAVGGIDEIFDWVSRKAPLRRNIGGDEVGKTALYLVSDLASGVTGENIFVDAGYNIVGL